MLKDDIEKAIRDLREYEITVRAKDGALVIDHPTSEATHPPDYVSSMAQMLLGRHASEAIRYLESEDIG